MKISDFLSPTDVMIDVRSANKLKLLQELSRQAASTLNVPAERISSALLNREELGCTGMGGGVAIPHARLQELKRPFGIFVRLKREMDFGAIDSQPVDLVFLLLLPAAEGDPLNALASVARKLRTPEDLIRLRGAKNQAELYSAIAG